jgi:hypothetical protein
MDTTSSFSEGQIKECHGHQTINLHRSIKIHEYNLLSTVQYVLKTSDPRTESIHW